MDESDTILYFVGCNYAQISWKHPDEQFFKHEADPIPLATRMAELNVSVVRLCIRYEKWIDPTNGTSGRTYKEWIDDYVRELTSRGIYCWITNMGNEFLTYAPDNPTPWLNFLTEIANRYKDNPGMCGISIWNEVPLSEIGYSTWYTWANLAAEAIHDANPNLLILVRAYLPNRQGMDPYWVDNPIQVPNVVYYYHTYYWQYYYYGHEDFAESYDAGNYTLAKQQMEQTFYDRFFKYAVEHDMPIMCEEFGFNGGLNPADKGYGNEPGWPQCQIDFMDLHEKYQIPWNQYSWWIKNDQNYGLAKDDYYTLSSVGEIWQQYLKAQ
jgi:hypothetical protein